MKRPFRKAVFAGALIVAYPVLGQDLPDKPAPQRVSNVARYDFKKITVFRQEDVLKNFDYKKSQRYNNFITFSEGHAYKNHFREAINNTPVLGNIYRISQDREPIHYGSTDVTFSSGRSYNSIDPYARSRYGYANALRRRSNLTGVVKAIFKIRRTN